MGMSGNGWGWVGIGGNGWELRKISIRNRKTGH